MENAIVLSGLTRKRAYLAGELIQLGKRLTELRGDIDCLDRTMRLFDPTIEPQAIRAVVRRPRPPGSDFRHGEFTRIIMGVLRDADAPMSANDIAAKVVIERGMDASDPQVVNAMAARVRGMLARQKPELVVQEKVRGQGVRWRVA